MALTADMGARELGKFREPQNRTGEVSVAVVNPDGSPVGGGGGGAAGSGSTPYKLVSVNTVNGTNVTQAPTTVKGIQVYNINASARYLKIYNKATAPTVGTDVPVKVILIPGGTAGAGSNVNLGEGIYLSNGLSFALTTGIQDSDTTAVAANEIIVNIDYKL